MASTAPTQTDVNPETPGVTASCSAFVEGDQFVLRNDRIERRWRVANGLLYPASLRDIASGVEWLAQPSTGAAMVPRGAPPEEAVDLALRTFPGRQSAVEAESLVAELSQPGTESALTYRFQIFPGSGAIVAQLRVACARSEDGGSGDESGSLPAANLSGIETAAAPKASEIPADDLLDDIELAPLHLRLTAVAFVDQTDGRNELVHESEWLLHPAESRLALPGNLFVVEDVLTGNGLVFLKHAPIPYARPVRNPYDLLVQGKERRFRFYGHGIGGGVGDGYECVTIAYTGGAAGRTAALQHYQRRRREYVPGRDALFLSNTWGDRSRDGRVTEAFLREEVGAAYRLGVDVVQIDDGWQQGTTANSVESGGVWNGFWNANPNFWQAHAERLPNGLQPLVDLAAGKGMRFGLWFAPDSSDDFARWEKDAEVIVDKFRTHGIRYFKIDGVKIHSKQGERNLRRFYDRVLEGTGGEIAFDTDVTAETRPGYFGVVHTGPLFVENRYTDSRRYWPHHTLRNLWKLAHFVDPLRLRMEFLNNSRNTEKYGDDPLAPARYRPSYLFATVMFANPLGWFEVSNLPESYFEEAAPLVRIWKAHRDAIFSESILPIGAAPDGTAWTGFLSISEGNDTGYVVVFRERNDRSEWRCALPLPPDAAFSAETLFGDGQVSLREGVLHATIPRAQDFLFARLTRE